MPKIIKLKELNEEETVTIKRLAHSRTEPARKVERAGIIWQAQQGRTVPEIAQKMDLHHQTVRMWLKRFNEAGLAGLEDDHRPGRQPTYSREQVSEVIAAALSDPKSLNLPFGCWTLDRLEAYLNEQKGIAIKRSRIDEILVAEGLRWRKQESWFGERVDPDFAQKRGLSKSSTPPRRRKRW